MFKYIVKSKFTLFCQTRIYRERGERFQDSCIIERDSHRGGSVMVWAGESYLHHKNNIAFIKGDLNCSSLSTRSAQYGGHSFVEKPQRNAVAARWCSSPSGRDHHCISECKQCKCRRLSPKSLDLNIIKNIFDELNRSIGRTGAIPTTLN